MRGSQAAVGAVWSRRRLLLGLSAAGAAGLLASCTSAPPAPPAATQASTAPASGPAPGATAPTVPPTVAATSEPTRPASPTPPPTATAAPTATPAPTAVPVPTAVPTLVTPPALASAVEAALSGAIAKGWLPGGVALVQQHGARMLEVAYGLSAKYASKTSLSPSPIEATTSTLYDLASVSKLFTTTCLMRLVEAGRVGLDDPVARTLPEFAAGGKEAVTVRQLLTHTSGLPDYLPLWQLEPTPEDRLRRALETPLHDPPGTVYRYSDLGLIALGHLVEQLSGVRLDRAVHDLVTGPLGLEQALYRPPAELKPRIAATEDEEAVGRGLVWGEVHDENAWSLGGVAGHAGLFSTAADVATFAQVYLNGGAPLLRADTVAEMTRNQIGRLEWRGLGWELNQTYYMGHLASPSTYGHTGFTGTSLVVDPQRQLIVVLLTNRVHPTRDGPSINPTRQAVANAALAAAEAT